MNIIEFKEQYKKLKETCSAEVYNTFFIEYYMNSLGADFVGAFSYSEAPLCKINYYKDKCCTPIKEQMRIFESILKEEIESINNKCSEAEENTKKIFNLVSKARQTELYSIVECLHLRGDDADSICRILPTLPYKRIYEICDETEKIKEIEEKERVNSCHEPKRIAFLRLEILTGRYNDNALERFAYEYHFDAIDQITQKLLKINQVFHSNGILKGNDIISAEILDKKKLLVTFKKDSEKRLLDPSEFKGELFEDLQDSKKLATIKVQFGLLTWNKFGLWLLPGHVYANSIPYTPTQ